MVTYRVFPRGSTVFYFLACQLNFSKKAFEGDHKQDERMGTLREVNLGSVEKPL